MDWLAACYPRRLRASNSDRRTEVEGHRQCRLTPAFEVALVPGRIAIEEQPPRGCIGISVGFDDARLGLVSNVADAHSNACVLAEVLHPVRLLATTGQQINQVTDTDVPDLDLVWLLGHTAGGGQVAVLG